MRIKDLDAPVKASKADWLPGDDYLGFTPQGNGPNARSQCESTILRQVEKGYVLERITSKFDDPNEAALEDPRIAENREFHSKYADRLIAIHKLRTSRPLREIVGDDEFNWLQDTWATDGQRDRWSVAFPIVRSFEIVGVPRAKEIFPAPIFQRIYAHSSATLRPLDEEARGYLANLEIKERPASGLRFLIDEDVEKANRSEIPEEIERTISKDLDKALEGMDVASKRKLKKRASWLANRYAMCRANIGSLACDDCGFSPDSVPELPSNRYRTCLDVHHKDPLAEGVRETTLDDFQLLCPTCHRIAHVFINMMKPQQRK